MNIYKLAPIDNEDLFEDLCRDLWDNLLRNYKVKRFGRRGQKQKGLDITYKSHKYIIGIQCKCVKKLTKKIIDEELEKLEELEIGLNEYIIATTDSRDSKLDEYVFKLSQENNFSFDLSIVFWQDIEDKLFKEPNLSIIKDYYPEFSYDDSQISRILNYGIEQLKNGNYKSAENCLNTIKKSITQFSRKNNYEFCVLEGRYLEVCRKYVESGKKYIESYDYSLKDIKSKYWKALGLFYTEEFENAEKLCNEILEEDSLNELAYSLLLLIKNDKVDIPQGLGQSKRIIYNKGLIAYFNNNYEKSYEYLKKSEYKNPIELINCVNVRFQLFLNDERFPIIINQEDYDKLATIEKIFQESIDKLSDTILINYIDQLLRLLTINRLLGNYESLNENVERGLRIDENNEELLFYKAVLLEKNGKENDALEILKKIPNVLDSFKLIYLISIRNNDYDSIIEYGKKSIDVIDRNFEQHMFCQEVLIEAYIQSDELVAAKKLVNDEKDPFRHNLLKSELCSEKSEKKNYLLKSHEYMKNKSPLEKLQLALKFLQIDEYKYAIPIYESIIDLKIFNPLINDLAYCYLHNEDYAELIKLSESFIEKGELHPHLIEFEIETYLKIDDFDNALRLINIYIDQIEPIYSMKIAKAKILLFKEDYGEVDEFIDEKHDFNELELRQCLEIYAISQSRRKNEKELFEMLFEIRNAHIDDKQLHIVYTQEFLNANIDFETPSTVQYETGVLLRYDQNEELVYVTKNHPDIRKFSEFEKIINHAKGDSITLETNITIEILEIYDKFTFAFKESLNIVKLNSPEYIRIYNSETTEEILEQIKEITLDKHKGNTYLKSEYNKGFKPLCIFSEVSGMDLYDSYYYLKEEGLKSFSNDELALKIKKELVLDLTSILTIHLLKIEDKIAENYTLHISTTEYFELKRIQDTVRNNLKSEIVAGYDRNDEFRISNANYKEKYNYMSKIINWVEDKCELTKCSSLLELDKKDKENLNQIPYNNIKENILLAYDNNTLVSDDLDIKKLITNFFEVETCGTLTLIHDMFYKETITKNEFDDLILKLYENNFKELSITAEQIIKSIKEKNYGIYFKFILDITKTGRYMPYDWDMIIKNLNTQNINEKILFEMTIKLMSNIMFIAHCDPLLIELDNFNDMEYIASKHSNIFHNTQCSFAKKISKQNTIHFKTKEMALKNGYIPCNKCIK